MKKTFAILVCLALVMVSCHTLAQRSEAEKTWRFQGKNGVVEIKLTRFAENNGEATESLEIYSPDSAPRSVAEEATFLATVLEEMPKADFKVNSLGLIISRLNESEAIGRVATCTAQSKPYRIAFKSQNRPRFAYPLITAFINDCKAYEEWRRVLASRGLALKAVGVEKVSYEPFSKAMVPCPVGANCIHLFVPADALVQYNIEPLSIPEVHEPASTR